MTYPDFYKPERAGTMFVPQITAAIAAGQSAQFSPATNDANRIALLLVDEQVDFVHEDGSLSVPGAVADTRRMVEWIYRHSGKITTIAASLDSHIPLQIFFPTWWEDSAGNSPDPFTVISAEDVESGKWQPRYEKEWSKAYVRQLESRAKKQLMIWTYHVLIGTPGHNLTPALYEALAYHSAARQAQPRFLSKGTIPKTEHYSIFEPEIKVENEPSGSLNVEFLEMLASHDLIYLSGQAKSHCVLETVTSVMRHFADQPDVIAKFRVLMDCTSSVAHPEIDFDAMANETFADYESKGLNLVKSTDDLG